MNHLQNLEAQDVRVYFPIKNGFGKKDGDYFQKSASVTDIKMYPKFEVFRARKVPDFAILILSHKFAFYNKIQPVCLASANQLAAIRICGHRTEFYSFGLKRQPEKFLTYNSSDMSQIGTTHFPAMEYYLQITAGLEVDMKEKCRLPHEDNWTGL